MTFFKTNKQSYVVVFVIVAIVIIGIASASLYFDSKQPVIIQEELESQNYEDICGYPVTDKMRMNIISKAVLAGSDPAPYLEVNPATFTHMKKSQYLTDIPRLQYWFELEDGKYHVYFELGACDLDDSDIAFVMFDKRQPKPPTPDFDTTKYETLDSHKGPLIYKDTLLPVLDEDNCKRVAKQHTEQERGKMYTRENPPYDQSPPWKNQLLSLMNYCQSVGTFEIKTADGNINWSFTAFE